MDNVVQTVNDLGYPEFVHHATHYGCIYGGSKLIVLTLNENQDGARLDLTWRVPNLRELCTLRADDSIPATMKFAFRCGDLVHVDFVLRPKLVKNSHNSEHWLTFSARVVSQGSPSIFKEVDVFIVARGEPENCKKSSVNGAVYRNNYCCQIPLFPISDLFSERSDPVAVREFNDIDLNICIKLKKEEAPGDEQHDESDDPLFQMYDEIMRMIENPAHGDFIITGKDACYYVHRAKVEKHPLLLNIRQLHSQETEVDLSSWDQAKLEMLLCEIYSSTNDEELERVNRHAI